MKSKYITSAGIIVGLLVTLVISLCVNALAANVPAVATLASIVNGLRTPLKMVLDDDGNIYVADPRSGGVVVLNKYGVVSKTLTLAGSVSSVALLNANNSIPGGKILVGQGNNVAVLDQDGAAVLDQNGSNKKLGSGDGQFVRTAGMAVAPNGYIYVVDSDAYNVKVFHPDGAYSHTFGSKGIGYGVFQYPTSVSVITESTGIRIAVVDTMGGKVDIFTPAGVYTNLTFGTAGVIKSTGPLLFTYPSGIALEYANGLLDRVYIADMFQGQIQAISSDKQFLAYVGSYGKNDGNLLNPSDVQFDPINKRLLVANGLGNIVSFGIDGGQNPVNSTPPILIIDPIIPVTVPSIVLTGSVDTVCTITASANTPARVSAASYPSALTWMIPVDGLVPGVNVVSITAKNGFGTTITKTATIQYTPPGAVFSINSYPSLTSQSLLMLSGTALPGSKITVNNSATAFSGNAYATSSGVWSYTLALVEGVNAVDISVFKTGTTPSYKDIAIKLDSQAPVLTVAAISDGSYTTNQVQNISGTAVDANLSGVTVNGVPVDVHNGVFSYAVELVKGNNVIIVAAGDSLGHITSNTRTIVFDPDFPKITVTSPADGSFTNLQDLTISGTVDEIASVKVNGVVANPDGGLEWTSSFKLSAGLNEIKIEATDQVGHVSNEIRIIVYDTIAPNIAITIPSQDVAMNVPGMTIKGTVAEDFGIKSITASVNGTDKPVTLLNGEFSLFADFAAEGTYAIAVTVSDDTGNVTVARRTIVYDVTPPALTLDPITVTYPTALTGTVEAGATVVIKDAAGILGKVTCAGEIWTANLTGLNYDISTLVAQATDASGNVSVVRINAPVPDGDMNGDGSVTIEDANIIIKLVASKRKPTLLELLHGDIGPLRDGKINPNGKLDMVDAILIQKKALGKLSW